MATTYEMMGRNQIRADSALLDLELLNERITQTLLDLGLTEDEAKVLLFLNKKGEMKVQEVAKNVEIPRTHMYNVLQSLQSKGLVVSTIERPAKYKALSLNKAVDVLIESYKHKLRSFEKAKDAISHDWSLLQECEVVSNPELELKPEERFQIISGENAIYSRVKSMITQAAKQVDVFANLRNLAKLSYADVTDKLQELASNGIAVKILTNLASSQIPLEEIDRCKVREIPPHFNDKLCFIMVDGKDLLLLNLDRTREASCVWTNSGSFVDAMSLLFTVGWRFVTV